MNRWAGARLSLLGRKQIINIVGCSKIWFTGTQCLLPKHYLKLFTECIFRYLWNFSHTHPISQSVLYNLIGEGGLGIVNIKCKLNSFYIQHLAQLIKGHDAKWTYFATYWTGLKLRHYNKNLGKIDRPHSETMPTFYQHAIQTLDRLKQIKSDIDIVKTKTKQTYEILLTTETTIPDANRRFLINNIDKDNVWTNIYIQFIDHRISDVTFKLMHGRLMTKDRTFRFNITTNNDCTFCDGRETAEHLFYDCR